MYAVLASTLTIYDPGEYRQRLARLATYRIRGRIPAGQRRIVRYYQSTPEAISLPRGLLPKVRKMLPGLRVIDQRLLLPRKDFALRVRLRPYQEGSVRGIVDLGGGVLIMPAGAGKTVCGMAAVSRFGQRTLWMVHTLDLAKQALSEARQCFNLPAGAFGFIGERMHEPGTHFTVAMVQTLAKMRATELSALSRQYGTIVADECHHLPAQMLARVITRFPARHLVGLSATTDREDGLGPLIFALVGPGSVSVPRSYLIRHGYLIAPEVRVVRTGFRYRPVEGDRQGWAALQRARAQSVERNRAICDLAAKEFRAGHRVAILVGLRSHARRLEYALSQGYRLPAVAVTGEMDPQRRERVKRDVEAGRTILIATQLFDEGVNMPSLDRLILAAPIKSAIKVEQQTGRTARIAAGKSGAVVYDFADVGVQSLRRHARRRLQIYEALGYTVRVMASRQEGRVGT